MSDKKVDTESQHECELAPLRGPWERPRCKYEGCTNDERVAELVGSCRHRMSVTQHGGRWFDEFPDILQICCHCGSALYWAINHPPDPHDLNWSGGKVIHQLPHNDPERRVYSRKEAMEVAKRRGLLDKI